MCFWLKIACAFSQSLNLMVCINMQAPNDNESVALVEDPATNFSFKDYDWSPNLNQEYFEDFDFPAMMSSPYGYQNVGSASRSDYAPFSDFKDSDFSFPEPHD